MHLSVHKREIILLRAPLPTHVCSVTGASRIVSSTEILMKVDLSQSAFLSDCLAGNQTTNACVGIIGIKTLAVN